MKLAHTLYICYFGLREPLVQTQGVALSPSNKIRETSSQSFDV